MRERIIALPYFQENGHFIGETRYRQMLQMANPPLRPDEFEEQIRRSIAVEKLRGALTDWIAISDREVEDEFKRQNEKVKLAVSTSLLTNSARRWPARCPTRTWRQTFEERKNDYRLPEKRKVEVRRWSTPRASASGCRCAPQDVQRHYEDNQQQYSTPEQVRASHILLQDRGQG